tara:strand:+ start:1910 stop:2581 length:672 start_codon:yes stop_codon:yes gene_type:complete
MNLIIINHKKMSYLFNKININGDGFYFIYDSTKIPIDSLKTHILENDPEKIISLDFAVPITGSLKKNTIVIAKEIVLMNSRPINWAVPRSDRWIETSSYLNKSISNLLEKNLIEHSVVSGMILEHIKSIKNKDYAKEWLFKNIQSSFVDNSAWKIAKLCEELSKEFSIIRIINNKTPLFEQNKTKEMITKMKNYITNGLFYNFVDKNILKSDNNELIKTILEI